MSRWVGFFIFAIFGLALFWCGLQMPVHLRAVDPAVLQKAGRDTPSLVDGGLSLVANGQLGPAQLFLAAARSAWITNSHELSDAVDNLAVRQPSPTLPSILTNLPTANPPTATTKEPNQPPESFAGAASL